MPKLKKYIDAFVDEVRIAVLSFAFSSPAPQISATSRTISIARFANV